MASVTTSAAAARATTRAAAARAVPRAGEGGSEGSGGDGGGEGGAGGGEGDGGHLARASPPPDEAAKGSTTRHLLSPRPCLQQQDDGGT